MDLYNASTDFDEHGEEQEVVMTLEEYEDTKKSLQAIIDRSDAARRLAENDDFKALVMDGYLAAEPIRLAELMSSGRLNENSLDNCKYDLRAVGSFRNYMKMHIEQGNLARDELVSLEEARDLALEIEANS